MILAEEILDAKESYNFLSMAEKRRVIIAMEKYYQSRLSELKERVDNVEESKLLKEIYENNDYLRGVNEGHQKAIEHVLNLIEKMQS